MFLNGIRKIFHPFTPSMLQCDSRLVGGGWPSWWPCGAAEGHVWYAWRWRPGVLAHCCWDLSKYQAALQLVTGWLLGHHQPSGKEILSGAIRAGASFGHTSTSTGKSVLEYYLSTMFLVYSCLSFWARRVPEWYSSQPWGQLQFQYNMIQCGAIITLSIFSKILTKDTL